MPEGGKMTHETEFNDMPVVVRAGLRKMDDNQVAMFMEQYNRKKKSTVKAYLSSLFLLHYVYLGKIGTTVIMWVLSIMSLGVIGFIWWFVDLFRIPKMMRHINSDIAIGIMRDQKILGMM
jgi:TM2 domain-containing membrane protein YozV